MIDIKSLNKALQEKEFEKRMSLTPGTINSAVQQVRVQSDFYSPDNEQRILMEIKMCDYWLGQFDLDELTARILIRGDLYDSGKSGKEYNMYLHYLLDNYIPNFKNIKLGYEGKKAELAKQLIDIYVNRAISVNDEGEISIQDEQAFVKLGDMSAGNDTGYTVLASKLGLANESLVSIYASFLQSCYNLGNADAAQAKNILRELYSNFELGCFSFTANQLAPVINRIRKYADEIMARADAKEYENIRELVAKLLDSIDRRLAFEEKR